MMMCNRCLGSGDAFDYQIVHTEEKAQRIGKQDCKQNASKFSQTRSKGELTNSPTNVSLEFARTFVTNASAVFVLTNKAPHACIARSRIGGLSSTRSEGVCTIGSCGKNCVKKIYTFRHKCQLKHIKENREESETHSIAVTLPS